MILPVGNMFYWWDNKFLQTKICVSNSGNYVPTTEKKIPWQTKWSVSASGKYISTNGEK